MLSISLLLLKNKLSTFKKWFTNILKKPLTKLSTNQDKTKEKQNNHLRMYHKSNWVWFSEKLSRTSIKINIKYSTEIVIIINIEEFFYIAIIT